MSKTLVLIPSRMSATRLPGKPLLKINNLSIISNVFKKAQEANIGEVVVATEDQEIFDDVVQNGGRSILTKKVHKTGTDRIYEAYKELNIRDIDLILNLQGDEPNIDINDIINLNSLMIKNLSDFGTLASEIKDNSLIDNKNVVKVITEEKLNSSNFIFALDFFRKKILKDYQNIYHHIGIYSYTVNTLERFISLNQTKNEIENKLEQLRALDNNIKINIALSQSLPIGVDTEEDYLAIKKIMEYKT